MKKVKLSIIFLDFIDNIVKNKNGLKWILETINDFNLKNSKNLDLEFKEIKTLSNDLSI